MSLARSALIFALGLFAISAQALPCQVAIVVFDLYAKAKVFSD